jgi:hypothetical protein
MQRERENKVAPTYAAIRIRPDTRNFLRKIGRKTETYDQIIHTLIDSYVRKEEEMLHRVVHKQDGTPVIYGNVDATREGISSLLPSSTETR